MFSNLMEPENCVRISVVGSNNTISDNVLLQKRRWLVDMAAIILEFD